MDDREGRLGLKQWLPPRDLRPSVQHYKPPDEKPSEYQTIPLSKIEDFGVHANSYYSLDISYFKSSLDAVLLDQLWGKYWVNTLASSPLLATRDLTSGQMRDIGAMSRTLLHAPALTCS